MLDQPKVDLCVVILTFNEELHLARCLQQVAAFTRKIFIVDSHSTDRTVEIAQAFGATVLQNRFVNHAKQLQWALDNAPIQSDWVMRLDADEIIEPDLGAEIARRLPELPADVTGINLKRKLVFMGRWIRHGGRYPVTLLRIWRRGQAAVEDRWMDEHIYVLQGRTITLEGGFTDENLNDLSYFTDKHNRYATREALDVLNRRFDLDGTSTGLSSEGSSRQAALKRWLKERLYNRIPFQISAALYFLYRYVFQLGFLDGREGLIYHALQGFWYRFLVGAKVEELGRAVAGFDDRARIAAELSRLTGMRLSQGSAASVIPKEAEECAR